uniref:VAN3-binding protein-like auxin canalisation domain-containing protein n=1 Tax=Zea mays TaxID=4577 RepID=A0A804ME15_MAIZE
MEADLERGLIVYEEPGPEPTDLLSSAWCSSAAIRVLHAGPKDECSMALVEHPVMALGSGRSDVLAKSGRSRSLVADSSGFSTAQWKYDDLKSWLWLQKAIHPELDYDLCLKKKWLPRKMAAWNGTSLKKWVKERKQRRKEEARLQRAEVHAAVSVAGVAAALAAVAAENAAAAPRRAPGTRETAVASAAALVAAQCAKAAEAAGASRGQVAAAVDAARASTDAGSVITLTAAAATSLACRVCHSAAWRRDAEGTAQLRARAEREGGARGAGAVAGRPRLRLEPREVQGGAGQGRRDARRDAGREVEAPHGVGGVEQARRDRAADQEDEPRRHGPLLPRKRKCGPRRAGVRPGEAEPRRGRDIRGGGLHGQGQGGAPRGRLRGVQAVGRNAEPHARHVHRRLRLRQARAAAPRLTHRWCGLSLEAMAPAHRDVNENVDPMCIGVLPMNSVYE